MPLALDGIGFGDARIGVDGHTFKWNLRITSLGSVRAGGRKTSSSPVAYRGNTFCVTFLNRFSVYGKYVCLRASMPRDAAPLSQRYRLDIEDDAAGAKIWSSGTVEDSFSIEFEDEGYAEGKMRTVPLSEICRLKAKIGLGKSCILRLTFISDDPIQTEEARGEQELVSAQRNASVELIENVKALQAETETFDVQLEVSARSFGAHKTILMARSPVFNRMFQSGMTEQTSGRVEIPDCDPGAFEVFLQFLYSGSFEGIAADNVANLCYIANKYGCSTLVRRCLQFMKEHVSVEKFCDFLPAVLAAGSEEAGFLEGSVRFLADNFDEVGQSAQWKDFCAANPLQACDLMTKACTELASRSKN